MFIETITQPREEWQIWSERFRFYSDPPKPLAASFAWNSGNGNVTQLNVWDNPAAVGDLFMERASPMIEELGEPTNKPERHGAPLAVCLRGQ